MAENIFLIQSWEWLSSTSITEGPIMQKIQVFSLIVLSAWGLVNCGSSASKNVSSDAIGGSASNTPNAFALYSSNASDANIAALSIVMSSSDGFCSSLQQGTLPKNSQFIELDLSAVGSTGAGVPTQAGTFTVYASDSTATPDAAKPNVAYSSAGQIGGDANCVSANTLQAVSGSASIEVIGNRTTNTSGTYNVTLSSNDILSGTFTATPCVIDAAILDPREPVVCN